MREIVISGCNSTERNIAAVEQNSQVKHIVCNAPDQHVTVGHCCCEVDDGERQAQDNEVPGREEVGNKFPRNAGKLLFGRGPLSRGRYCECVGRVPYALIIN
jgi:hypothetical protein